MLKIKVNSRTFVVKDYRFSSVKGLMFDSMKGKDGALIHANSIWMPFVKRDLFLVFLDKGMRVTSTTRAVPISIHPKTWKVYKDKKAKYCLELKQELRIKKGTKILVAKK